jgi:regulator of protease activity HflC (stomatin/prohibitin superfamily)
MTNVMIAAALAALVVLGWLFAQLQTRIVYEWEAVLLYENGRYVRTLEPGRHRLFHPSRKVDMFTVRTNDQMLQTGLVDVTSIDKLPFRVTAWGVYRVRDPHGFHVRNGLALLDKTIGSALVETSAGLRLEDLLAGRKEADERLLALAGPIVPECELVEVHFGTIQLPPETRRLFIEVEKARLEGLAALERARGEHASLRSLANAARLLKDNPALANLRLLQSVANAKGSTTIVLGQSSLAGYPPETGVPVSGG